MPDQRHWIVFALIIVCGFVFAYQQTDRDAMVREHGAVPTRVHQAWGSLVEGGERVAGLRELASLATAVFLHGDFEHILFNMVFLWTFGALAAQQLGPWWTLAIFLVCGIAGNVTQVLLNLDSPVPIIGASGAVFGLQGLYLALALGWRLPPPDVWPLAHPIPPLQLAAFSVLGFLFDVYALMNHQQEIAYGAHVGGFLMGLAMGAVLTAAWPRGAGSLRG